MYNEVFGMCYVKHINTRIYCDKIQTLFNVTLGDVALPLVCKCYYVFISVFELQVLRTITSSERKVLGY
jgi:hypothetical protein